MIWTYFRGKEIADDLEIVVRLPSSVCDIELLSSFKLLSSVRLFIFLRQFFF